MADITHIKLSEAIRSTDENTGAVLQNSQPSKTDVICSDRESIKKDTPAVCVANRRKQSRLYNLGDYNNLIVNKSLLTKAPKSGFSLSTYPGGKPWLYKTTPGS